MIIFVNVRAQKTEKRIVYLQQIRINFKTLIKNQQGLSYQMKILTCTWACYKLQGSKEICEACTVHVRAKQQGIIVENGKACVAYFLTHSQLA